ncbi:BA14K family protein [Arvimicrobium flavum]|uniref:BA14K family protein n=1 Tax=Arvimicrobium flavum TaxID=3393320 RepID=UPI00237B97C9|nr:BA14K family protein [Mesorhizobium shangrilense]
MRSHPQIHLPKAIALLATIVALPAHALTVPSLPADAIPASDIVQVQDLCGTIGNCGIGMGGVNTLPRNTIVPDIGRFDPGHDNRFGRYRYEPPDQQLDLSVPRMRGSPPARVVVPRYTGTRTNFRVKDLSADHVDWCYAKYKSYRAKDNSYQPASGPRKVCVSPFS